jgi:hypothetical protein
VSNPWGCSPPRSPSERRALGAEVTVLSQTLRRKDDGPALDAAGVA